MRFCPFCAAENADDATHCPSCAKRLPPVRPRKKETRAAPVAAPPTPTPSGEETVVDPMPRLIADPTPAPDPTPLAIAVVEKAPVVLREPSQRIETHRPGKLVPMPDPPETGLWAYARYALAVWRGRYDRRRAARELGQEIKADVVSLDGVLGALGREVRAQKIVVPGLAEETRLIEDAEARRQAAERVAADLREKTSEENAKFQAAKERFLEKLAAGQRAVDDTGAALDTEEGKRKALREKRKELERRYRDLLKRTPA